MYLLFLKMQHLLYDKSLTHEHPLYWMGSFVLESFKIIFERINVFKEILWAGLDSTNWAIMLNSLCNDKRYMIIKAAFSCPI